MANEPKTPDMDQTEEANGLAVLEEMLNETDLDTDDDADGDDGDGDISDADGE